MADIDNFRQLLQYFVAHLEFCNANLLKEWNGKTTPLETNTRGFKDFIESYFKASCKGNWDKFKRTGNNTGKPTIQKQIAKWAIFSDKSKITIGINATGPNNYKSNTNFLNWNKTWNAIRVKDWNVNTISSLEITKDQKLDSIGVPLDVIDNLYDNTGQPVTNNTSDLQTFWDEFNKLRPDSRDSITKQIGNVLESINPNTQYWRLNIDPNKWDIRNVKIGHEDFFKTVNEINNKIPNYGKANKYDVVLGYETNKSQAIVSLLVVSQPDDGSKIYLKKILDVQPEFLNLEEVNSNAITKDAFKPYRTTFKDISMDVFAEIISMMIQKGVLTLADFKTAINSIPSLIGGNEDSLSNIENNKDKDMKNKSQNESSHPLNLILYGPPGTGKTYNTLFKALEIIKGEDFIKGKSYDDLKPEFDRLVSEGQIVFTTFHQSMSYEDFIEGIKPIPLNDEIITAIHTNKQSGSTDPQFGDGTTIISGLSRMKYDVKDGIFKQICEKAEKAKICCWIDRFVQSVEGNSNSNKLKTSKGKSEFEVWHEKDSASLIVLPKDSKAKDRQTISIDLHLKKLVLEEDIERILEGNLEGENNWPSYTPAIIGHIIGKYKNEKDLKYPPYVLIIDEINRGNVAQIFGELITLIEPSKRLGNSEEMKAILPYSSAQKGEPVYFGVPNNVYIIGTMNTADRSVEALDTALRRRFSFEEMMPDKKPLEGKPVCNVGLDELLETINKRIVALKDREHQIGHSYFMGCPDDNAKAETWLTGVFKDKIIPLLQEYFYGDYKKIYYVLGGSEKEGEGFVKIDSIKPDIFAVKTEDFEYDIPEKRYEIQKIDDNFNINKAITMLLGKQNDDHGGSATVSQETSKAGGDNRDENAN